jgi:DNA (cytosine-5)-methyltransferase 1
MEWKTKMRQPTIISLFAGCGGSSLGYKWAGYKELLAIDFDKNAIETFKLNFPDIPCWQRDIKKVTGKEILDFCKIKKGELFALDASPPCQGFSMLGKYNVNDPRNNLFLEFIRLIKELRPYVFIMENVPGLIKGKMVGRFIEIMKKIKFLPYQVKCKLMNTMYYGVPQSRQRLIWIGIRKDLKKEPCFPKPNNKYITVEKAIGDLSSQYAPITELYRKHWKKARYGESVGKYLSRKKLHPHKMAFTNKASSPNFHYKEPRPLSVLEMQILQSFPRNFRWKGAYSNQCKQIGNSVPPKFMEAIANQIRETVEYG